MQMAWLDNSFLFCIMESCPSRKIWNCVWKEVETIKRFSWILLVLLFPAPVVPCEWCWRKGTRTFFKILLLCWFTAPVVSGERLRKYVFHKICSELPEGPFCIVYMHSTVQKEDNSPGMSILRWIYEDLPMEIKERLQLVYFVHPGIRSRLVFATLGRLFLSGG